MKIINVINEMEKMSPAHLQLDYDNSGLQTGDVNKRLKNILVTLDVDEKAIKKAKKSDANLVISHHPLIFKPINRVDNADFTGKSIISAIKNDISIYSMHTNFDAAAGGMNDLLGRMLDVEDLTPLMHHEDENICKLVFFVPAGHEKRVTRALFAVGAGVIGDYSGCSFSQEGVGSFTAKKSAIPFIGKKGKSNLVEEKRIEMVIERRHIPRAIKTMMETHPYEEPAFDIYPLINTAAGAGLGRIGTLKEKVSVSGFIKLIKKALKVKNIRLIGNEKAKVKRVAICSGSGGSLIGVAKKKGADTYITGDIKYHEARMAEEAGLTVIDAGHFHTEEIFVDHIKKSLTSILKSKGSASKVFTYKANDPFKVI